MHPNLSTVEKEKGKEKLKTSLDLFMPQTSLQGLNNFLGDQPDPDTVGMNGRQYFALETGFHLLKLCLSEPPLHGSGHQHKMLPLSIRNSLQIPEIHGDRDSGTHQHHNQHGPWILKPSLGPSRPEMVNLISIDIVEPLRPISYKLI